MVTRRILQQLQGFRQYPSDYLGIGLILAFTPVTYLYGVVHLIPNVFEDSTIINQLLAYTSATWCALGILTHLYQVRTRRSSILGRILPQPVLATSMDDEDTAEVFQHVGTDEQEVRRRTHLNQSLGQQFMAKPFGSQDAWHICAKCEVYVPNRTWHCSRGCNTCILRRDHHCVFAMACVGEENHSNFLGLLVYLAAGTTYAGLMLMCYAYKNHGTTYSWFLFQSLIPAVFIWVNFSLFYLLSALSLLASLFSWALFIGYVLMASKGQTSADLKFSTKPFLSVGGVSYYKLEQFLGPNPLLRMVWPFHSIYTTTQFPPFSHK